VHSPPESDACQHRVEEEMISVLIFLVFDHKSKENACGYHKNWQQTVEDVVASLA